MNSGSRAEARRENREGMREIARQRRELRYGGWDRDRGGDFVAGVVLGAVPQPPGLCWHWSDPSQERGYWDRCGAY